MCVSGRKSLHLPLVAVVAVVFLVSCKNDETVAPEPPLDPVVVKAPLVMLTAPDSGAICYRGDPIRLTWRVQDGADPISTVMLEYQTSSDPGRWKTIVQAPVAPAEYIWTPQSAKPEVLTISIRPMGSDNAHRVDSIHLVDPPDQLRILSPLPGEKFLHGASIPIRWRVEYNPDHLTGVELEYMSARYSRSWTNLGHGEAAAGGMNWIDATQGPTEIRLRIRLSGSSSWYESGTFGTYSLTMNPKEEGLVLYSGSAFSIGTLSKAVRPTSFEYGYTPDIKLVYHYSSDAGRTWLPHTLHPILQYAPTTQGRWLVSSPEIPFTDTSAVFTIQSNLGRVIDLRPGTEYVYAVRSGRVVRMAGWVVYYQDLPDYHLRIDDKVSFPDKIEYRVTCWGSNAKDTTQGVITELLTGFHPMSTTIEGPFSHGAVYAVLDITSPEHKYIESATRIEVSRERGLTLMALTTGQGEYWAEIQYTLK